MRLLSTGSHGQQWNKHMCCSHRACNGLEALGSTAQPCVDHADKTWKILEDAIHEINNHNASGLSFEELYRYPKHG